MAGVPGGNALDQSAYSLSGLTGTQATVNPFASSSSSGGQPMVTPDLMGLLIQIYGMDPFRPGSEHRDGGPLYGIPANFIENIIRAQTIKGEDVTQANPDDLTQLIQDYWTQPQYANLRNLYGLVQNQSNANTALVSQLSNVGYENAPVPPPFSSQYFSQSGYGFGQPDADYGPGGHPGVDYGVPMNTPLVSPFTGRTHVVYSNTGLGNHVELQFGNGWKMIFGHMNTAAVTEGELVHPGQLLGYSGSTGNSTGAHLHFEIRNPSGQAVDPSSFLQQAYKGTTFSQLMSQFGSNISGRGLSPSEARLQALGIYDTQLHSDFSTANSAFKTYFGREPSDTELLDIVAHGNDEKSFVDYIRTMPSHISGIAIGPYTDTRTIADALSKKIYGHDSNDTIIKELYDKGLTSDKGVQYYYDQLPFQPGKDVSPIVYDQLYKSAAQYTKGIWNQEPHPVDLQSMFLASGAPTAVPASQANAAANPPAAPAAASPVATGVKPQ